MILLRPARLLLAWLFLGLFLHQAWLSARDSLELPSGAADAQTAGVPAGTERFDPFGGEILIAAAGRPEAAEAERQGAGSALERG